MTRPDDVEARLRAALVTADEMLGREGVDMSAEAITRRIAELAEMSSLCLALAPEALGGLTYRTHDGPDVRLRRG